VLLTIIGLILVLAAAFYVTWPLFSAAADDGRAGAANEPTASAPEHDKEQALIAIREADFDHRTGKLSDEDYGRLREELEGRALAAIAALDSANALHPVPAATPAAAPAATQQPRAASEPGGFCPACGVRFARDARFCPGCGKKLPAATPRGRRRA